MSSATGLGTPRATRVLVVDDDVDFLQAVKMYLSELGFSVDTAKNGAEALRRINIGAPDVLLLDLVMPGMSGTELMVRLREMGLQLPTIVVSGDAEAPRRLRGQAAQGILIKPFSFTDLLPLIRRFAPAAPARAVIDERGEPP